MRAGRVGRAGRSRHPGNPVKAVTRSDASTDPTVEPFAEHERRRVSEVVEFVAYVIDPSAAVVEGPHNPGS